MQANKIGSYTRESFPWLQNKVDAQGLNGWWLPCHHHIFREVLLFHGIPNPWKILLQPLHLVFFVDKNRYPWIWEGPEEDFQRPRFNQGVQAQWHTESQLPQACFRIHECLQSGRIPIVYFEWFHVPFATHYQRLRGNLHAVAILEYNQEDEMLFVLDRTALPTIRGGFEKDRGWVSAQLLEKAVQGQFGWLDYHIGEPTLPWQDEIHKILQESISNIQLGHLLATPHSDHGLQAILGFRHFIETIDENELGIQRMSEILRWHLPPCIRRFVIGQHKIWLLAIKMLVQNQSSLIDPVQSEINKAIILWEQVAVNLVRLGFEKHLEYKILIMQQLEHLYEQEERLCDAIEKFASTL